MINFLAENPILMIVLMCLCNPPGLITAAVLVALARRYNWRNPLIERGADGQDI